MKRAACALLLTLGACAHARRAPERTCTVPREDMRAECPPGVDVEVVIGTVEQMCAIRDRWYPDHSGCPNGALFIRHAASYVVVVHPEKNWLRVMAHEVRCHLRPYAERRELNYDHQPNEWRCEEY